ncbi:hypothetical protein BZA77DRAFT_350219 [Pyronema omphalodes]|nr:hypothetical protein BZA77DRAFT_350219 [Pyronema omphalodes]
MSTSIPSDGEDSQMPDHDHVSVESSTPSTPPATNISVTSPPNSQSQQNNGHVRSASFGSAFTAGPSGSLAGAAIASLAGGNGGDIAPGKPVASWENRRALDEAEHASERLVHRGWHMKWLGDPLDESDMWKA